MSTSSQTHVLDHLREHVEESDFALTERLGLRPTHYPDSSDKATHPDQRPCPPWCWVGQNKEYGHEIEWNYPATALHSMEGVPTVFASRYAGHCSGNSSTGDRDIRAATIEPHLKQRGQGEPVIDVYLRCWPKHNDLKFEKRLSLSVQDAQDLIVALEFLVDTAEGRE